MDERSFIAEEKDPERLKELVLTYAAENARLHRRIQELVREIAKLQGRKAGEQLELELSRLQEQMHALQRQVFADSSERREGTEEEKAPVPRKPRRGHGPRPQAQLRRKEVLVELAEDSRQCDACKGQLAAIPGMTEDSEQITVIRREFVIEEVKRQKYRCRCGIGLHTAPGPVTHQRGGRYSLDFAIEVAVDKYVNHLPLARQRRDMARRQLDVSTQALWDQIEALAGHLQPVNEALRQYIIGADVIGVDETHWRLMAKKESKKWWVWALSVHDAVWFGIDPSRSAQAATSFLGDFHGTIMCDGYRVYDTLARNHPELVLAHCWSHVRRKFLLAQAHYPQCQEALDMVDALFAIERKTLPPDLLSGDAKMSCLDVRRRLRDSESRPLVEKLRQWALAQRGLPKSSLRKATDYMLGCWSGLIRFLDDPCVPLDNNRTERALRAVVLGRKNHYGSRSQRGTEVAALFYSLLDTAVHNGLDPTDYLKRAAIAAIEDSRILLPLAA